MIYYIGNFLSQHNTNPAPIELLSKKMAIHYPILVRSNKKNKIARLFDICFTLINKNRKISLIIIDTYAYKAYYFALIASILSKVLKIPYMTYLHSDALRWKLANPWNGHHFLFSRSAANIAPSAYLKEMFNQKAYDVTVIPNIIDINLYSYQERTHFKPQLLWVRAFHPYYNPGLVIEIIRQLLKIYPDTSLTMVGPVKDNTFFQDFRAKILKNKLENHIHLVGYKDKKELIHLSKTHDIFINTANLDNQPVSVIEAMALGLPIVSTNVGGLPYLIDDSHEGWLVEPNNAHAFTQKIVSIIENSQKTIQITQKARKKAEQFTWEKVHKKWDTLIQQNSRTIK